MKPPGQGKLYGQRIWVHLRERLCTLISRIKLLFPDSPGKVMLGDKKACQSDTILWWHTHTSKQKFPKTKEATDSQHECIFVITTVTFSSTNISIRQLALDSDVGGNSPSVLTLQFSLISDSPSENNMTGTNTICANWKSYPAVNNYLNCRLCYLYFSISLSYCNIFKRAID